MTSARDRTATIGDLSLHYLDWGTAGLPAAACASTASRRPRTVGTRSRRRWRARITSARSINAATATRRGPPTATIASRPRTTTSSASSRAIDAAPAVLVALSMGGLVALTLAARAPRARARARRRRHRPRGATRRRRQHPQLRRRHRRARHVRGFRDARPRLQSPPLARQHPRAPAPQPEAAAERTLDVEIRSRRCAIRRASAKAWATSGSRSRRSAVRC